MSYFYNDRVPHLDWNGKLPSYPQQAREAKEVVHHSTVRAKNTLLFLNLRFDNQPKPPFQHPKINCVPNAVACILTRTSKRDHISPVLASLYWLCKIQKRKPLMVSYPLILRSS